MQKERDGLRESVQKLEIKEDEKLQKVEAKEGEEREYMKKQVREAQQKADDAEYRHQMATRQMKREKNQVRETVV